MNEHSIDSDPGDLGATAPHRPGVPAGGWRGPAAAVAFSAAVLAGWPWVSASASAESTSAASYAVVASASSSARSSSVQSWASEPSSVPSCETSRGAIPFPDPPPSGYALPSWVSASDLPLCVLVGESDLRVPEPAATVTVTPSPLPAPEPSDSPGITRLNETLSSQRALLLYSGGLTIFLLGMIAFRSRKA